MRDQATIYCVGRCNRPAVRIIDGEEWCTPCLKAQGFSEAEGVAIRPPGASIIRAADPVATRAAVEKATKPVQVCKNHEHKKPVPLISSNKSGWCSECSQNGSRRRIEKAERTEDRAHAHASIGNDETDVGVTQRKVATAKPAKVSKNQSAPKAAPAMVAPAPANGHSSALKMRVLSAAEYADLTNRFLNSDLEPIVDSVRMMLATPDTMNSCLVVEPPAKVKARGFRDQLQRYFDHWHKDIKVHVSQHVKLNHVAITRDRRTGKHVPHKE